MLRIDALQEEEKHPQAPQTQGVAVQWLLDEQRGSPHFGLQRFVVEVGGQTVLHRHEWEHAIYVLSGEGELIGEDVTFPLQRDTAVLVAPGEKHQFRNTGDKPLKYLVVVPSGPATIHQPPAK
ncbi:MAG TPA: cupin domain-containing protein [Armatimonadota bacterium]|jgi:quercetin dioxygenase-like cupin family protein